MQRLSAEKQRRGDSGHVSLAPAWASPHSMQSVHSSLVERQGVGGEGDMELEGRATYGIHHWRLVLRNLDAECVCAGPA